MEVTTMYLVIASVIAGFGIVLGVGVILFTKSEPLRRTTDANVKMLAVIMFVAVTLLLLYAIFGKFM